MAQKHLFNSTDNVVKSSTDDSIRVQNNFYTSKIYTLLYKIYFLLHNRKLLSDMELCFLFQNACHIGAFTNHIFLSSQAYITSNMRKQ